MYVYAHICICVCTYIYTHSTVQEIYYFSNNLCYPDCPPHQGGEEFRPIHHWVSFPEQVGKRPKFYM